MAARTASSTERPLRELSESSRICSSSSRRGTGARRRSTASCAGTPGSFASRRARTSSPAATATTSIQEGMIGLYKAVRDFRPDKETSFRSFAELCVTRQIITAIKTATRFKHSPLNTYVSFSHTPAGQESEGDCTLGDALPGPSVNDPSVCVISTEELQSLVVLPRHGPLVARVGGAHALPRGQLLRGDGGGPRLRHEDDRQRAPARQAEDPRAPEDARSARVATSRRKPEAGLEPTACRITMRLLYQLSYSGAAHRVRASASRRRYRVARSGPHAR